MRPVDLTATPPAAYAAVTADVLARDVLFKDTGAYAPGQAGGQRKRPRAQPSSITVADALQELSDLIDTWVTEGARLVRGAPSWTDTADTDRYELLKDAVERRAKAKGWGSARSALIAALGQYCSYCDTPMRSVLHIEHVLPKSMFPMEMFSWANFLLACPSCNSAKGKRPNQTMGPGGVPLSTQDAKARFGQRQLSAGPVQLLWPHMDWPGQGPGQQLPYRPYFCYLSTGRRKLALGSPMSDQDRDAAYAAWRNGSLQVTSNAYYVPDSPNPKRPFAVFLLPRTGADALAEPFQAVAALVGLNTVKQTSQSSHTTDHRLLLRTEAYFLARRSLDLLGEALQSGDAPTIEAVSAQICSVIRGTGFWDVWVAAFSDTGLPNAQSLQGKIQPALRALLPGTSAYEWLT